MAELFCGGVQFRSNLFIYARFEEAFGEAGPVMAGGQKVEIMTIHKAKGLEFDMVFVPALDAFPRHS